MAHPDAEGETCAKMRSVWPRAERDMRAAGSVSAGRLPLAAFRTPHSALRFPLAAFRTPHSVFCFPLSAFRFPLSANAER